MPIDAAQNVEAVKAFLRHESATGRSMRSADLHGRLILFSYAEPIAVWRGTADLVAELSWNYSRTTKRHRKLLLRLVEELGIGYTEVTREQIRMLAGLDPLAPPPLILSG